MSARRPSRIVYDADGLAPDAGTVDTLARLALAAKRLGLELRLRHASGALQDLLAFAGLGDVLRLEAGGQPEEREQRRRVDEERDLGDPAG